MKKILNKTYSVIFLLMSFFIGISTIGINHTNIKQKQVEEQTITRSVSSNNLKDDVESLVVAINVIDRTISYDIEFKQNSFNGTEVNSYFFHMDEDAEFNGAEEWIPETFINSSETVENKKALNTTSFGQIDKFDYISVSPYGLLAALGVSYEKDGAMVGATINPIHLNLAYFDDLFEVSSSSSMVLNDEKTVANISFNITYDYDKLNLTKINLKSHSDSDLNQNIYDVKTSALLPQGSNNKNLTLMSEYHYYDLYLEFVFSNNHDGIYLLDSDIEGVDFTSGFMATGKIDKTSLIVMIFIILLVILMIIIITLIIGQMKKRRRLEKQQDKTYYENNYGN